MANWPGMYKASLALFTYSNSNAQAYTVLFLGEIIAINTYNGWMDAKGKN